MTLEVVHTRTLECLLAYVIILKVTQKERNDCTKFAESNRANMQEKHDFCDVYSTDANTLKRIVGEIGNIWEFRYANGRMKKSS